MSDESRSGDGGSTAHAARWAAAGCAVAPVLLLIVPILWRLASLPLTLTPLAKVLYVSASLAASAWIGSAGSTWEERRLRFVRFLAMLLVLLALPAFAVVGWSQVLQHFRVVSTEARSVSPDGRLVLIHRYIDSGALGGDSQLVIRGRLVPGLVDWEHVIPVDDYPSSIGWASETTVSAGARDYRVPDYVRRFSW